MLRNFGHNAQMQLSCTKHSLIFKTEEVGTIIADIEFPAIESWSKFVQEKYLGIFYSARFKVFSSLVNPSVRLVAFSST